MLHDNKGHQELIEKLKDEAQADAYFYEVIEKCKKLDKQQAQEQMIVALQNIAQAQGGLVDGLSHVLPDSGTTLLYKTLSSIILKLVK
jgi:hypothetical protein